jgi:acylphosphatase
VKAVHVLVSGDVQGVGYRQGCRSTARSQHLVGWVRNLVDGRVELFAQGSDDGIDRLLDWVWAGPSGARVVGVETDVVAIDFTLTDFFIQPGPSSMRGDDPTSQPPGPSAS